jgi:uncharacterized protein (TIGR02271 family)
MGDKVGTAIEQNEQGGYLVVEKGLLFIKDVYVPLSAISRVDNQGVYLNLTKEDLKRQNWETPPSTTARAPETSAAATTSAPITEHPMSSTGDDISVPVREEELMVGKREEEAGRVRVTRDVVEEQQTTSIPLTHDEVIIERVPVEGRSAEVGAEPLAPDTLGEKEVVIPLRSEEPVVGKRAEVSEELHIRKQQVTEEQQVSGTVRKERVNVEGVDEFGATPIEGASDEDMLNRPQP